jgi:hypothetical protein
VAHKKGGKGLFDRIDFGNEVNFIKSDIRNLQLQSFDPFTHVYIFAFSYSFASMAKVFDLIHAR